MAAPHRLAQPVSRDIRGTARGGPPSACCTTRTGTPRTAQPDWFTTASRRELRDYGRAAKATIAGETKAREQAEAKAAAETLRADRAERAQRDMAREMARLRDRALRAEAELKSR